MSENQIQTPYTFARLTVSASYGPASEFAELDTINFGLPKTGSEIDSFVQQIRDKLIHLSARAETANESLEAEATDLLGGDSGDESE